MTHFVKPTDIGGRNFLWTPSGGSEINLGATVEGSRLFVIPNTVMRTINRYGTSPYAKNSAGFDIRIEALFLQKDFDKFENFLGQGEMENSGSVAATTLDGAITDSDTEITITAFTGFENPSDTGYVVTIEDEEILVRAVNAGTLTLGTTDYPCERGYNGTTAVAHTDTTAITRNNTVIHLNPIPGELITGGIILRSLYETSATYRDVNVFKACLEPNFNVPYTPTEDEVFQIIATGLVDENNLGKIRMLAFGDVSSADTFFPRSA